MSQVPQNILDFQKGFENAKAANAGLSVNIATNPAYKGGWPNGGPVAAPVDPYANTPFGSTAKFNQVQGDWRNQQNQTNQSITDRIGNEANTYRSGILDYLDQATAGQKVLNERGVQNELSRQQGNAGVLETIGRGVKSGGVTLANKGASTSSAADALARAYSDIGGREMNKVGQQFEQDSRKLAIDQDAFGAQLATGARHLNENKANIVNSIVSDAQNAIAKLNADAASASLPDRIDIESRKAEIRNSALGRLQAFDGEIANAQNVGRPQDANATRAQASQLMTAGNVAANPYDYTSEIPTEFGSTGPFASELPLFQSRRRER